MKEGILWSSTIRTIAKLLLVINIAAGFGLFMLFQGLGYGYDIYAWISLALFPIIGLLTYPFMMGFSKIVEAAEFITKDKH